MGWRLVNLLPVAQRTNAFTAVEIDMFFNAGRKSLGFRVSIEIDLVLVKEGEIDLISAGGIELNLISVYGRN